ncbi:MAG: T9SS type A sorting domain-containing protein [Bacteroidota bacterium]
MKNLSTSWKYTLLLILIVLAVGSAFAGVRDTSIVASGLWNSPSTWSTGQIPGIADTAIIMDGTTVLIDSIAGGHNNRVGCLIIGGGSSGILQYNVGVNMERLYVAGDLTVNNGGSFLARSIDSTKIDSLNIGGNLLVNGTFDLCTHARTSSAGQAAVVKFSNGIGGPLDSVNTLQTISGSGFVRAKAFTLVKGNIGNKVVVTCNVMIGFGNKTLNIGSGLTGGNAYNTGTWVQDAGTLTNFYTFSPGGYYGVRFTGTSNFMDSTGSVYFVGPTVFNTTGTITASAGSSNSFGFENGSSAGQACTIMAGTFNIYTQFVLTTYTVAPAGYGNVTMTGGTVNIYGQGGLLGDLGAGKAMLDIEKGTTFNYNGGTITLVNPMKAPVFTLTGTDGVAGCEVSIRGAFNMNNGTTLYFGDNSDTKTGTMGFQIYDSLYTVGQACTFGNIVVQGGTGGGTSPGRRVVLLTPATVTGTLTIANGAALYDSNYTLTANGNIANSGTHTSGSGKLYLNGGGGAHQLSGNGTYGKLELNDAANAQLYGSPSVSALTLTSGTFTVGADTLTLLGNMTGAGNLISDNTSSFGIAGSATGVILPSTISGLSSFILNNSNGTTLQGPLTVNGTLNLTSGVLNIGANTLTLMNPVTVGTGTLVGGGSSAVTIAGTASGINLPSSLSALNNLTINNGNGTALQGPLSVAGAVTLTSGALTTGANTLTVTGSTPIVVTGGSLGTPSIVAYAQSAPTIVVPTAYNTLNLTGATTFTLGGSFSATNVTVSSGATLTPASTITGTGTLEVDGTLNIKGATFDANYTGFSTYTFASGSTANYDGSIAQTVKGLTYDNLTLNNTNGVTGISGTAIVNNTLTLTLGNMNIGSGALVLNKPLAGTGLLEAGSTSSLTLQGTASAVPSDITTIDNLTLNNASGGSISADLTVDGALTLTAGALTTGANKVILAGNLVEAGNGSIVLGTVQATRTVSGAETFGGIGYDLDPATGSSPGATTVTRVTGTFMTGAGHHSVLRYYDVSPTNTGGLNSNVVFHFDPTATELNGSNAAKLDLFRSPTGSLPWYDQGFTSRTANSVSLNGVTQFSRWTASDTANTLSAAGSQSSDVVAIPASESGSISSLVNDPSPLSTSTGAQVWRIRVRDGGGVADADDFPTILTEITFTQGAGNDVPNWLNGILAADLFDSNGVHLASGVISANSIAFSSFVDTAKDNDSTWLSLRISLKNPLGSGVAGDQKFVLSVTSANVQASGVNSSAFGAFPTQTSDANSNEIQVIATKLAVTAQPSTAVTRTNFTVGISGVDANGNIDPAYAGTDSVSIAAGTGTLYSMSTLKKAAVSGTATFSDLRYSVAEAGVTIHATNNTLPAVTSGPITFTPLVDSTSTVTAVVSSEAATISSLANDSSHAVQVWSVNIIDGGAAAPDSDDVPTILNGITFTPGAGNQVADWSTAVNTADLFDGLTFKAHGVVSAASIAFSGFTATAPDNGTKALQLHISLKNPLPIGSDNQKFVFEVLPANVSAAGSQTSSTFAPGAATAISNSASNAIAVVATQLRFVNAISNTSRNTKFAATAKGTDANGNTDLDFNHAVTFTIGSGTPGAVLSNPTTASAVSGVATTDSLKLNLGGTYKLAATYSTFGTDTSNSFIVNSPATFRVKNTGLTVMKWDSAGTWIVDNGGSILGIPHSQDSVILDNKYHSGNYTIQVGVAGVPDSAAQITIGYTGNTNTIKLQIPTTVNMQRVFLFGDNTAGNYDLVIAQGGVLDNENRFAGSYDMDTYAYHGPDSIKVKSGGLFYWGSPAYGTCMYNLSRLLDGDYGTVEYDVPSNFSDFNWGSGYVYPNLVFSNTHSAPIYYPYGSGKAIVKGNLTINTGVVDSFTVGAGNGIAVYGNIINNGNTLFDNSTVVMIGSTPQTISGSMPIRFRGGLAIANAAGVTASTTLNIEGGLVQTTGTITAINVPAAGVLNLGSTVMNLVGGALSEGNNPVIGQITATRTLSSGVNESFGSLGFSIQAAGTAPGSTTVLRTSGTALTGFAGHQSVKEYFDVTPSVNTGANAQVVFTYANSELNGLVATDLMVNRIAAGDTSARLGIITSGQPIITVNNLYGLQGRWTAASSNATLYLPHILVVRKDASTDGNISNPLSHAPKKWWLSLYKDSVNVATLVNSQNPPGGILSLPSLEAGKYIAQEADSTSTGWLRLGTIHHGTPTPSTALYDTVNLAGGIADSSIFINQKISTVTITKLVNTTGDLHSGTPKKWHLALYKGSVSVGNRIAQGDTSVLSATNLQAGTYIATEADSSSWVRVNGNRTNSDTLIILANQSAVDTFINFQPNTITIMKVKDADGLFSTSNDRVKKSWHLELRKDSLNGAVVNSGDTDSLTTGYLGDGTYYAVEADSAGWTHLGYVLNSTKVPTASNNASVPVAGGQNVTITFVNASPSYVVVYRTVDPNLMVEKDIHNKVGKGIVAKVDKYNWTSMLASPAQKANDLHIEFATAVDTTRALLITGQSSSIVTKAWDSKLKKLDLTFADTLQWNDSIYFDGFSKGKQKITSYYWTLNGTSLSAHPLKNAIVANQGKLPMPNRINLLMESFPTSTGLLVGRAHPDSVKKPTGYGWILAKGYKDVLASLLDGTGYQTGSPRGFDKYDTRNTPQILGAQKSIPPAKENNMMIADMLALRVNIYASALGITPDGFYNLIYNDTSTTNPFNGLTVTEIADTADAIMMGYYAGTTHTFADTSVFGKLHRTIAAINNSFEGSIDTIPNAGSYKFNGTKKLIDVPFLHANPGAAPMVIVASNFGKEDVLPQQYKLYQNYPNPFNPTTNIQFDLPQMSTVTLKVYNILGQEVATLLDHTQYDAGVQTVPFNASNYASGVYFYRLITSSTTNADGEVVGSQFVKVGKMLLIK